jgi:hypothetical protein
MNRFDVNSVRFVREACEARKWAFAADYIRLHALFAEGGFYLDTDVIVKKRFDDFLEHRFVSSYDLQKQLAIDSHYYELVDEKGVPFLSTWEKPIIGFGIQGAIFGSEKQHPFVKECLDYYQERPFILSDKKFDLLVISNIMASIAEKYGFRYKDERQSLDLGMEFYPTSVFAPIPNADRDGTYAVHCCEGSWIPQSKIRKLTGKIKIYLSRQNWIRKLFRKKPLAY